MRAGKSAYGFISKVFTLPSETTLNEYSSPSASSPDGILWKTLKHQKKIFDGIKRDKPVKKVDPLRMGILKWDEMEAKEGIEADPNTGRIVGYSHESFHKNAVFAKMKSAFCATDGNGDNNGEEGSSSDPEYAKKYLCFIFDTVSKIGQRFKFVAARFALRSSDGFFYYDWIPRICAALYMVGFIVIKGACDGATENRSAMKMLCDVTFGDVLERYTPTVPTKKNPQRHDDSLDESDDSSECSSSEYEIRSKDALGYPPDLLDIPIAFEHPSNPNILVFWDPDMPHAVKKLVNALERSGLLNHKTDLRLKGTKISLRMLKEIWERAGDAAEAGFLLLSKLGLDHFEKNPNSRMRAFLAFQVMSMTMVLLIDNYAGDDKDAYAAIRELILVVDRYVDIMNATVQNGTIQKYCEPINDCEHKHTFELLDIACFFCEWKREDRDDATEFIPLTTYEDLVVCCLGTVGVSWTYLGPGSPDWIFDQKRCGTDENEHHHGNIRVRNPNPSIRECQQFSAKSETFNSNNFNLAPKTNTGGERGAFRSELFAPVYKKSTK